MRHCSTRLNAADLSKITAPHATLDFRRVCVGSKAVKNFAVSNGLSHAVLVAISTASLPPELAAGTTPASQVVPGEATAGFDIALHCAKETLGYRCVVQYTINDRHTLKLAITADVVPVELTLGSPELAIEFDALARGVVPPFGSTVVAVTWTPSPVLKNVGKLLVHVPGAKEDLELAVTGKLDDAKCAFGERKLDFQTVSVGMERDLAASVLNTGQCAAVCNVEVPPEVSDFLFVSHTRFRLVPGGTQHLTVSLKPRAPRTLDGTTLLCHVRGAKSVRLPVTGSAIIPDVRILAAAPRAPPPRPKGDLFDSDYDDDDLLGDDGAGPDIPTLDFADQFVGFEERRRIVLQNESEIGASSRSTSTLGARRERPGAPPPPPPPAGAKGGGQPAPPKSAVFFVSPKEGKLQPGESTTVRVTFVPTSSKDGAHPRLEVEDGSDDGYVRGPGDVFTMPTVPTGVQSRVLLYARNRGFEHIQLNYRLPPHVPVKLTVDFPEGRALGVATPRLCVVISFCADAPVSFAAALQLLDSDGNAYTKKEADAPRDEASAAPAAAAAAKGDGEPKLAGVDPKRERPLPAEDIAPLLVLFLNYHALNGRKGADAPLKSIPEDCVASHGRVAIDAIEALAGRKVPGRLQRVVSNDKELMAQLVAQYQALLLFMVERGALLNAVRPEQLLSKHHYIKFREQQADFVSTRAARDARHATWDGTWAATFASLPGVLIPKPPRAAAGDDHGGSHGSSDPELAGSNVYSVGECVVLKWLGYHAAAGLGNGAGLSKRFDTFGRAFEDPGSLCAVLASNAPSLVESGGALAGFKSMNGASPEDKAAVSDKALHALEALRCDLGGYGGDADEGTALEARAMSRLEGVRALLVALHLYLTMPNFVPKTTIEFNAQLGAPMCKMIELRNTRRRARSRTSNVESHAPVAVFEHESTAYEAKNIDVVVKSPFLTSGVFEVSLANSTLEEYVPPRKPAGNARGGAAGRGRGQPAKRKKQRREEAPADWSGHGKGDEFEKAQALLREPFWTSQKTVRLDASGATNLNVQLLSCSPGLYKAELTFLNGDIGEFVVEVLARVHLPKQMDHFKLTVETEDDGQISITKLLRLPPTNPLLERAFAQLGERDEGVAFEVTTDSPFFQCPDELTVVFDAKGADKKGASKASSNKKTELVDVKEDTVIDAPNSLVLSFYPQKAGTYLCAIASQARPGLVHDIRILNVEVVVTMPRIQTVLEFKAPARRKITQDLPLMNASDEDWMLSVNLQGSRVFSSGPQKLKVPAGGRASFPLTFAPTWTGVENAKLTLRNARSPDAFEYTLTTTHGFLLENASSKPLSYKVESDLPFVSGASTIDVPANSSATYDLKISPSLGGAYTGSVTFSPPTGEYVWYTIKVQVDSPLEESAIDISTTGDGLIGEPRFTLEADEAAGTYELFYTPLIAQSHAGSVVFLNDRVGEFWYRLNLSAAPAEPTRLDVLECAVGARTSTMVTVENPLNREITLVTQVANRANFVVEPSVSIPPYGSVDVEIQYVPSEIGVVQESTVVLRHDVLGDWEYVASGAGTTPGLMNEHTPSAIVGEPASYMFSFRNPFGMPLDVDIDLETTDEHAGALSLLMRRSRDVRLAPHVSMSIPLSFDPVVIAEHHAVVKVIGDYRGVPLAWTFPIRGIVNAPLQLRGAHRGQGEDVDAPRDRAAVEHRVPGAGRRGLRLRVVADGAVAKLVNSALEVQFKLVNSNAMDYTPFNAFFSTDSAHTLTVSPAHGLLAPVGTEGTNFDVSFRPVKYGMLQRGRLIIQTEDMMWSYEVHGTHPSFTVPVSQSKVDTHMSKKYVRDKARH
ncbi:hypothetical protein JL721_5473 [Aureococcus anophagefferens]|nr:hypothetical protein JL721_5473 [Aureococcus anophagefferens]